MESEAASNGRSASSPQGSGKLLMVDVKKGYFRISNASVDIRRWVEAMRHEHVDGGGVATVRRL